MSKSLEALAAIRAKLLAAEDGCGLWETAVPASILPSGMTRGEDSHLAYLTLVYAISGGREPTLLWQSARQLVQDVPDLFDPSSLAYSKPTAIEPLLVQAGIIKKRRDATVWQRIGQALMMRAGGSVPNLLANYDYDAKQILAMLQTNKTTFPVLSGEQTAPRWLWGLARDGEQPLVQAAKLPVPISPAGKRALTALEVDADRVSAEMFDYLDILGRVGCKQQQNESCCPVASICPVATHCRFGD